ncbi:MAG: response regulator [Rhizobiales bacterium]|nr:response regulator [Hyphomicrobiales bacterium]
MQPEKREPTSVLVVDDSPETLCMLTDALGMSGMAVAVANSGREALLAVDRHLPDIVLMDAMMPGLDGFETCQILKGEKRLDDMPVIFMTGHDDTDHVVRALASGAVDFIAKPVLLDELLARIKVHLGNARKSRSARQALDKTGRRIIACDASGVVRWTTPQAAKMMAQQGLRGDAGDRLPWEVIDWLGREPDPDGAPLLTLTVRAAAGSIEFRLLERAANGEILLRLVNCNHGSDQERIGEAFNLTAREADVLLWITHGKSNKEIAEILDMSPRTVNKHLEQVFDKLGIENRTAAATKAVRVLWDEDERNY